MSATCTRMRPRHGRLTTLLALIMFLSIPLGAALLVHHVEAQDPTTSRAGRPFSTETGVWLAAVVTDPQTDRGGTDSITTTDEAFVLWNANGASVDLTGWSVVMDDGTTAIQDLEGTLGAGASRIVVNPGGTMNNDVTLRLLDAGGNGRDTVTLGAGGIADGDATDADDEVVHLVGPWAALKGPWAAEWPLEAVWVETVARHATTNVPMAPAWHNGESVAWDLKVHAAPHVDATEALGNATLRYADGGTAPAATVDALGGDAWLVTTAARVPPATATARLAFDVYRHDDPDTFLDGAPLEVRRDDSAPTVPDEAVVATSNGQVHWLPFPLDAESGIVVHNVTFTNGTDGNITTTSGDACLPFDDPGTGCTVPDAVNTTAWIVAENGAGTTIEAARAVVVDEKAPMVPDIGFVTQVPPGLHWNATDEPLRRLELQFADDVTGVWGRTNLTLDPEARDHTDTSWVPGEPRAYRLVLTDRARHDAAGPWTPLPPEHVPVQTTTTITGDTAQDLVTTGTATVSVTFDRTMDTVPALVLHGEDPSPFWAETSGTLDAEGRAASYPVATDTALPATGSGTWRLVDGRGADGAPVADLALPATWDAAPPTVQVDGVDGSWVRGARHVVTVSADDVGADDARITFDTLPSGVKASGPSDAKRLTFRGDGLYEVRGHAADAGGNQVPFVVRLGLDQTAPVIVRTDAATTGTWDHADPVVLDLTDTTSGLNTSSLKVWVQNATVAVEAVAVAWDAGTVTLVPSAAAPDGLGRPVEVHVAVADRAGNLGEGRVGPSLARHGVPAATADTGTRAYGMQGDGDGAPAPAADGPSWSILRRPDNDTTTAGQDGAASDASGWGGAKADAGTRSATVQADDAPASTSLWAAAALLGSVGLGTMVVRRRKGGGGPPSPTAKDPRMRTKKTMEKEGEKKTRRAA